MQLQNTGMRIKAIWPIIPLAGALVFSCAKATKEIPAEPTETIDEVIVKNLSKADIYVDEETAALLKEAANNGILVTKSESINGFFDNLGVVHVERLFPDTGRFEERKKAFGLDKWYKITYDESAASVTKVSDIVSQVPGIRVFEKERPIKINDEMPFDDPYLSQQWQYYNDGSGSSWKAKADINVFPVWKDYSTGSSDVIVGVVDGGIDTSHEDLKGVVNTSKSWNFVSNSSKISASSHGTHVGGTIGAINNNGLGVSGVAGGDAKAGIKGVQLLSCQIFSDEGGSGNGASAIVWAADHGAVVVNNSWGYDFQKEDGSWDTAEAKEYHEFFEQPNQGEYKNALKDAIDYFNKYAGLDEDGNQEGPMAGGVVFFSAGNEESEYGAPACYPGAIAVGAYGPGGTKAYYSNFGTRDDNWVDIAAPGGDYRYSQILSTLPGNAYGNYQGTSMACPHVTGVAALLVSALGAPGFTREMLLERLLNSPNPNFNITNSRIGIPIDAMGALSHGSDPEIPDAVTTLKASTSSNTVTATWNVTGSKNGVSAFGYRLFYGTDKNSVIAATAKNPGTGVSSITAETGMTETGESLSASFAGDFETTYYLKVLGYDYGLNYSENSNIASITTPANRAPVISFTDDISNLILKATAVKEIRFTVEDPDGHDFEVSHNAGSEAENLIEIAGVFTLTLNAPNADAGKYTSIVTATDSYGKATKVSIDYTILENTPPKNVATFSNILFSQLNETREFSLQEYFTDPDGDALTYSFQTNPASFVHMTSGTNDRAYLTSMGYGLSEVTITASDAKNASAIQSFKVLVREAGVEMQAYPSTVTSTLTVATGETMQSTDIKVASQTGSIFYNETVQCSAFEPAEVDMKNAAPGKYNVIVSFGGKEYRQTVVKK